jgi:nitric oxide dioxygenase
VTDTPAITEAQAAMIAATLPVIGPAVNDITANFYPRMFAEHPQLLKDVFNRTNQAKGLQPKVLAASIAAYATRVADPAAHDPSEMLVRIAHKHAALGITADQYQIVHDNLFASIVEVIGAEPLTPEVVDAWEALYWAFANELIALEAGLYDGAEVPAGQVFTQAVVAAREEDPSGVAVFTLTAPDGAQPLPSFAPGQFISVVSELADGAHQIRQYSLINAPGSTWQFAPKRDGEVSQWLYEQVQAGRELRVSLPFGDVTVDAAADTPIALVSSGIGVTPFVGMLAALAQAGSTREVVLVHVDSSEQAYPLRGRVAELAAQLPGAREVVRYGAELDLAGAGLPEGADVYLCGGEGFVTQARAELAELGVPEGRVHCELFTPDSYLV